MKLFYNTNKILAMLFLINQMAIWSYVTLIPLITSKFYSFSDVFLSYSVSVFLITFFVGITYMNVRMENKLNYTQWLLTTFWVMSLLAFAEAVVLHWGFSKYLFLIIRAIEGYFNGLMMVLMAYVAKSIISKHNKNGLLVSVRNLITYVIKGGWPIIITMFFIFEKYEMAIYIYGGLFYLLGYIYLYYHKKMFTYQYQRVLRRAQGKKLKNLGFFKSLYNMKSFFKSNLTPKIHFITITIAANLNRPFYDLYMMLFLMNYHSMSIVQTATLTSMMVFGQASEIIPGYFADKIELSKIRIVGLIIYASSLIIIIFSPIIKENYFVAMFIFYLFGLSRSFYNAYYSKLEMDLIKSGEKVNQTSFVYNFLAELTHYASYTIIGFILLFGLDMKNIMYLSLIPTTVYVLIWLFYDRKRLNRVI